VRFQEREEKSDLSKSPGGYSLMVPSKWEVLSAKYAFTVGYASFVQYVLLARLQEIAACTAVGPLSAMLNSPPKCCQEYEPI
jgi:hypothetical protein